MRSGEPPHGPIPSNGPRRSGDTAAGANEAITPPQEVAAPTVASSDWLPVLTVPLLSPMATPLAFVFRSVVPVPAEAVVELLRHVPTNQQFSATTVVVSVRFVADAAVFVAELSTVQVWFAPVYELA